jgi:hypothetical protein
MPLKKRLLRFTIDIPTGTDGSTTRVVLTEELHLKARINKAALAIQNQATLEVGGMSTTLRELLLSNFTAWDKRKINQGGAVNYWADVKVEAGYEVPGQEPALSLVYKGQVVTVEMSSPPPNVIITLQCFTRQSDKTKFISGAPPEGATFKELVAWAARQMQFGDNFLCDTSHDNEVIPNAMRGVAVVSALLIEIQGYYSADVTAFVDDDFLYVKDRDKVVNPSDIVTLTEFIGMPIWQEWGVQFKTLFDPNLRLAHAARLVSKMNPTVNDMDYLIYTIQYDLASRDVPFYVQCLGSPPSGTVVRTVQ